MFSSSRLLNWFFSFGLVFAMGCNGGLGGCGCGDEPLPSWDYIPVDQQVEGGGQIRVTPNGFNTLTALIPPLINDSFSGQCLGKGDVGGTLGTGATWCDTNQGTCTAGCEININVDSVDMSVPQDDVFNVRVQLDAAISIPVDYEIVFIGGSCTINATVTDAVFDMDINFGIDPTDGELTLNLGALNQIQLNTNVSGCGLIGAIVDSAIGFVDSFLNSFIFDLLEPVLRPLIDNLIQSFLPDPLGINNKIDLGALIGGVSPGTNATLEFRGVPGGYVALKGGGLSVGLITGVNADEDESTRTVDLDSEPALCVPPLPAIDFAAAPANLPRQASRGTFSLPVAGAFDGAPDPAADLAIGISETTLDLFGHHMVTSGAMCLGIGTELIPQLNLGTIGILVPSLAELGSDDGGDPLLLVTRPQTALDFDIGEGTETDPSLTIHLKNFEVDFYAFLFERFVRGFSITMSMDIGINLEFTTDMNGDPAILPVLTGLETDMIELTVQNSEFLREDNAQLEQVLPAIFDLALPLITDGLSPFAIPDFAGFSLTNLAVTKVTTNEDDFLALFASLGAVSSPSLVGLADRFPSVAAKLNEMAPPTEAAVRTQTRGSLVSVFTPQPAALRAGLLGRGEGSLPEIVLAAPAKDALGRPLEYTWSIKHGIIRPFRQPTDGQLVIRDPAFAVQGRHSINLQSRVVGDFRTHDRDGVDIDFITDSVGPRILLNRLKPADIVKSGVLVIPAHDLVSPDDALRFRFGRVGDETPWTDWVSELSLSDAIEIAGEGHQLRVWATDELNNESTATVDLSPIIGFHGSSAGGGGCGCDAAANSGASTGGLALLAAFTLLLLGFKRRQLVPAHALHAIKKNSRRMLAFLPYVGVVIGMSVIPACSCGGDPGGDLTCEIDEDCAALCPEDTIPICFDNQCVCADDVPYGRIGQHADMDVADNGTAWVSAYNSSHGDLMVASWPEQGPIPGEEWQFVDGVPDGPVVLPQSDVRGGIFDPGENVGQFTSIAVQPGGVAVSSYYDVDNGSLKFASNAGGTWATHVVEAGSLGGDPELGFSTIGKYSSITVRSDDGRPGIAYLAEIGDGAGNIVTELRYAAAQTATPSSSTDWNVWVVDTATAPAPTSEEPDNLRIPNGVGLFTDSARRSDETPVIVYYDRINGDLKLATFDAIAGTFQTPVILDSGDRDANNTDVGWYPSVTVDANDDLHVTYVSATSDDLYYINTIDALPEIVDDGYRIVGQNADGLPKPEFHFVGDDSSVVLTTLGPAIAYQDATTHELLLSLKNDIGEWEHETIAGGEDPFAGGYGFYAAAKIDGDQVVMSTWVIDQPANAVWVEIFRRMVAVE